MLPDGLNAITVFQVFYSVLVGYVWFLFVCLVRNYCKKWGEQRRSHMCTVEGEADSEARD